MVFWDMFYWDFCVFVWWFFSEGEWKVIVCIICGGFVLVGIVVCELGICIIEIVCIVFYYDYDN